MTSYIMTSSWHDLSLITSILFFLVTLASAGIIPRTQVLKVVVHCWLLSLVSVFCHDSLRTQSLPVEGCLPVLLPPSPPHDVFQVPLSQSSRHLTKNQEEDHCLTLVILLAWRMGTSYHPFCTVMMLRRQNLYQFLYIVYTYMLNVYFWWVCIGLP